MTRFLRFSTVGVALSALSMSARAETIALGGGWEADVPDSSVVSVVPDGVGEDFIIIEISKDFTAGPGVGGVFPAHLIDFRQVDTDANTRPNIIIADESVTNLTGVPWTDYHWAVLNAGEVWIDVPASAGFDTTPFANAVFSDPANVFGDPTKATDLDADGGVVPNNTSFFPGAAGGDLVLSVDLASAAPVSFVLKQFPTPEPASALLLVIAGLVATRRR